MQTRVRITNQRPTMLDLAIPAVDGLISAVLHPKGHAKDNCVCYEDALDHPCIREYLNAKGGPWITVEPCAENDPGEPTTPIDPPRDPEVITPSDVGELPAAILEPTQDAPVAETPPEDVRPRRRRG